LRYHSNQARVFAKGLNFPANESRQRAREPRPRLEKRFLDEALEQSYADRHADFRTTTDSAIRSLAKDQRGVNFVGLDWGGFALPGEIALVTRA
jgi:hypothetical protein